MLGKRQTGRTPGRTGARRGRPGAGGGGGANRYQMRQNLVSIGDDFWIENERREQVYKVDGKALRVRQTLLFEIARGRERARSRSACCGSRTRWRSRSPGGQRIAMVKKAMITPLRERWTVNVRGGPDMEIQGNLLDHEYRSAGPAAVAEVSKKWFRIADSYGVEIDPARDDILILAATVAVDMMAHPAR